MLVVLVLTVTLLSVPHSPASARPVAGRDAIAARPTAAPSTAATGGDRSTPPLVRAAQALRGGANASPRVEATLALRDLFLARPQLSALGDRFAGGLLARPSDGARDPFADGYSVASTRRCSTHVCVHFVTSTPDAPPDRAWVATTLQVMEKVWRHHVATLGYRRPARDGARGGDPRFDVYLKELGAEGLYGYCAPERRVSGAPKQASGYCVLDDDFARTQYGRPPQQSLRVTAAHEFFHAIQFAYDFGEDPWLLESTATWIEERFADDVDDNRAYLRAGQLGRPGVPLDLFETAGLAHYGNWTFWEFLTGRFGDGVVREVLRRAGTGSGLPDDYSTEALKQVVSRRDGLRNVFAAYAGGNTVPARTYPEGENYPASPVGRRTLSPSTPRASLTARIDHLTSRSVRLVAAAGLRDPRWRLQVKVDAPPASTSPAVFLVVQRAGGRLQRRLLELNRNGFGVTRLDFSAGRTRSVTVTLANASTRYRCDTGTTLACRGTALDQRQRYTVKAVVSR